MLETGHPIEPEELMAYLDGELEGERSQLAAEHLERCAECRQAAEDFRGVSRAMLAWDVEECGAAVPGAKPRRRWGWQWKAAVAGVAALGILTVSVSRRATVLAPAAVKALVQREPLSVLSGNGALSLAPQYETTVSVRPTLRAEGYTEQTGDITLNVVRQIARTTQLEIATKDFAFARAAMESIVNRHQGYISELAARTDTGITPQLTAQLQIPATELARALEELRRLGRVVSESQTAEDVTRQSTDLDARLANTRITEQRLKELLQQRTGKLSEVLEVEQQISRVRGEIEQMESERKALTHRVSYVAIGLKITEIQTASGSALGAAAREGWRNLLGGLSGVAEFVLAFGPSAVFCFAVLFFPLRFAWRRWKPRA